MKKAQASTEFVLLITFMLLVFIIVTIMVQKQLIQAKEQKNEALAKQLADEINNELKLANEVNPGYYREFYLPTLIGGNPYNMTLESDEDLIINLNGKEYVFFLNYNATKITPLKPGKNTIRN